MSREPVASRLRLFVGELKRRKVYHVAAVYGAVGVAISLGVPDLFGVFELPNAAARLVIILVAIGFPIALVLAWAYEVRPEEPGPVEGTEREKDPGAQVAASGVATDDITRKSIIVLPFDNLSPDPGDAYFSDGLTEEIISDLSLLHSLRVISRSSAMALKGTQKDVRTIGRELDVQYVLEGSVRKAGEDLRITAQLIDARTDEHLWTEKHEGVLDDVFGVQERVARSIVERLTLRLNPMEDQLLSGRPIQSLPAYECYLRARQHVWEGTPDALQQAVEYLETASELVGENALVSAGLAYVYFQRANFGIEQEESAREAERFSQKALELDPQCAQAEMVLGASLASFGGKHAEGIRHLRRARSLDPNDPDAVIWLIGADLVYGWMEEATLLADSIVQLDPLNPISHAMEGFAHLNNGQFEVAVESTRRAWEMAPDAPLVVGFFAQALAYAGRIEEFTEVRTRGLPPDSFPTRWALMLEAAALGNREAALEQVSEEVERTCRGDAGWSVWFLSAAFAKLGEVDRAMEWLENGVERGFTNYAVLETDPFLAHLKDQPRFREILERARGKFEILRAGPSDWSQSGGIPT